MYTGTDVDRVSVERARELLPQHRFLMLKELSGMKQTFQTVTLLAVIEHVQDPAEFLVSLKHYMKPGGAFVLTTPNPSFLWAHELGSKIGAFSAEAAKEHKQRIGKREVEQMANRLGLRVQIYRRFLLGANQLIVLGG